VRPAPVVALVRPVSPVLDESASVAVVPAPSKFRVERVKHGGVERADLHAADERTDVLVRVPHVSREGALLERHHLEVPVEQLVDRGVRARVPPLVDLAREPAHDLLGLGRCLGARWHDLLQVVAALGHRVDTGVHGHAQRAARQLLDAPPRPLPPNA
jgi:hypothetical protein